MIDQDLGKARGNELQSFSPYLLDYFQDVFRTRSKIELILVGGLLRWSDGIDDCFAVIANLFEQMRRSIDTSRETYLGVNSRDILRQIEMLL